MKSKILDVLHENEGGYVSGQRLCKEIGVSRTAVWKHIRLLLSEGYPIESSPGKGYRLKEKADILNEYEIMRFMDKTTPLYFQKTTESTNALAKKIAPGEQGKFALIATEKQTGGRGRLGRMFESENSLGAWCSFILKPNMEPEEALVITVASAIAVCNTVQELYGVEPGIKWPNDIIMGGKKVCGILSEMSCETGAVEYIVVGIGINVLQQANDFSEELSKTASSLFMETGCRRARAEIIAALCYNMREAVEAVERKDAGWLGKNWSRFTATDGKFINIWKNGLKATVFAEGIDEKGRLLTVDEKKEKSVYSSGEISIRGINGYI
ncbi:MAG: biotin--[acetyl-CoA-carboxylase] ligase [Clostridia bacterium]|nr:biotin--[acetyl-CoA-carboxylase] ligase [Clostridia bacterium]